MICVRRPIGLSVSTGVRPQKIVYYFLNARLWLVSDSDRLINFLYFLQVGQSRAYPSMHAQVTLVNKSGNGHFLEHFVAFLEERRGVINILFQLGLTLVPEPHAPIYGFILMGAAQ